MSEEPVGAAPSSATEPRRGFLRRLPSVLMGAGLAAGYGMFAAILGRFLAPSPRAGRQLQFVADLASFPVGKSVTYVSPAGERIVLTRMGPGTTAEDFIALSSVCPHLGCQVHWEPQHDRFFCPCHNGAFNAEGAPIAGPPRDANQALPRYELQVDEGLLFIKAATESLVSRAAERPYPPGGMS